MNGEKEMQKLYDVLSGHPKAIVIHCADPRFQRAFQEFLKNELNLSTGEYVPIAISGAIASLTEPSSFPKEFKVVNDILTLFLDRHETIKTIILINHEDCKKYEAMKSALGRSFLKNFSDMVTRQKFDLQKVASAIIKAANLKKELRLFYAKFANTEHTKIEFEEVKM
ncbi:MAG: hypothetical protein AB1333_02810 [Patescibacteria group bacterium]